MLLISQFDSFFNNRMKILLIVNKYQITIGDYCFCPLNQQEISELVPCSKLKVNQILKELIKEGYLEMIGKKGRYILTKKGMDLIEKVE